MLKVVRCEMLFLLFVLEKFIKLLNKIFTALNCIHWCLLGRVMQKSSVKWKLTVCDETSGDWARLLITRLPTIILVKTASLYSHFYFAILNGIFWCNSFIERIFIKRSSKKFNLYCLSWKTCKYFHWDIFIFQLLKKCAIYKNII